MLPAAIAGTLFVGIGAPTAIAAPGDDETTDTEAPAEPTMTGDQALAIIQQDYDLGAGGGQLSNFVHEVLVLRNLGFRPSKANQKAIAAALEKRPNQAPLLEALKATVSYQRKHPGAGGGAAGTGRQPRLRNRRSASALRPGRSRDLRRPGRRVGRLIARCA